jgi:hypothetical protein
MGIVESSRREKLMGEDKDEDEVKEIERILKT